MFLSLIDRINVQSVQKNLQNHFCWDNIFVWDTLTDLILNVTFVQRSRYLICGAAKNCNLNISQIPNETCTAETFDFNSLWTTAGDRNVLHLCKGVQKQGIFAMAHDGESSRFRTSKSRMSHLWGLVKFVNIFHILFLAVILICSVSQMNCI